MKLYAVWQGAVWALSHGENTEPFAWFRMKSDVELFADAIGMPLVWVGEE